ncbi:alpha/beta hydrolase [Pseudarthrobacter sp. HLT3-5]|uniref:alpha/beta hydrolase family protein n=1 Tax=Pseudarthrobacter cellobiosi TaxID=2953654 RepID=UPI00208E6674|nr:alpha/beta fold hydrolase [Pseudarthrobacter sp. HLT3-5]MCO4276048.1 alpha/beta hydrolase [Pseudarthrobacter sp. HLT3-5]
MTTVVRKVLLGLGAVGGVGALMAFLGAAYFAREVVVPKTTRREDLPIRRVFGGPDGELLIELPASAQTSAPGRYSIWFATGTGHACVGPVVASDLEAGTVTRLVERVDSGDLPAATAGIWSAYVFSKPDQLGLPHSEVEIPVEGGIAPAWRFDPAEASSMPNSWAIHIHGMGGKRAGALRGVPVAVRLGYSSLVVSFRNDGEAPPSADGRYTLGQTEWLDVEGAVQYAVDNGAQQIVLFGWSLGASIALRLADLSAHSDRIVALVLDAPVMDWTTTLTENASASGLPRWISSLGLRLLQSPKMRWVTGMKDPIDFAQMAWLNRAAEISQPTLVLHGRQDPSTPFHVSQQVADLCPDVIQLVAFDTVGHSHEWNLDSKCWEDAVVALLARMPLW